MIAIEVPQNISILCVDDEEGIIDAYKKILSDSDQDSGNIQEQLSQRRRARKKEKSEPKQGATATPATFNLFTASSGEEAVQIVQKELEEGRQISVGFFDMCMPGGIDGLETVHRIHGLDRQMLCAFVTAYTDRSPEQISTIVRNRDDWIYLNKPFTTGELLQTAHHLVSCWNQRRKEEELMKSMKMMQNGLFSILESVNNLSRIQPFRQDEILDSILTDFQKLTDSPNGFIILQSEERGNYQSGSGLYKSCSDFLTHEFSEQWNLAKNAMDGNKSIINGNIAASPLQVGKDMEGFIFVQNDYLITQDPKLLDVFALQAVNIIRHSELYKELESRNVELSNKNQELMKLFKKLKDSEKVKKEYEELTFKDFLTGIPNRRYLEVHLQEEISRCRKHELSLACLMIDIDHFKQINDKYGHAAGDYVLHELGKLLSGLKRSYDLVARYGGEEFTVVFGHIKMEHALKAAERLRKAVKHHKFFFDGKLINITVSIGMAIFQPTEKAPKESILKKADKALYEAKEQGRNCCIVLTGEGFKQIETNMQQLC